MKFKVMISIISKSVHIIDAESFPEAEQEALIENDKEQGEPIGIEVNAHAELIKKVKIGPDKL